MTGAARRIVVIHPGALGDLIIAAHAVHILRRDNPNSQIDAFTRQNVWSLFGVIDSWRDLETSGFHRLYHSFDEDVVGRADEAILWMGEADARLAANVGKSTSGRVLTVSSKPPPTISAAQHLIRTLYPDKSDITDIPLLNFVPKKEWVQEADRLFVGMGISTGMNSIAVHPGSGSRNKCWPAPRFAELIEWLRKCGRQVILIKGPADDEAVESVSKEIGSIPIIDNPRLEILAAILSRCKVCLGNDSGVSHLSAAVGTPTAAIFGPTDPLVWKPLGRRVSILHGAADCSPCKPDKRTACMEVKCFNDVSVEKVKNALTKLFNDDAMKIISETKNNKQTTNGFIGA